MVFIKSPYALRITHNCFIYSFNGTIIPEQTTGINYARPTKDGRTLYPSTPQYDNLSIVQQLNLGSPRYVFMNFHEQQKVDTTNILSEKEWLPSPMG
jgi:hypothetical protein